MRWSHALGVWALLAVVMTANGIFRELVLRPLLGETTAGAVSAALGLVIILAVTRPFVRRLEPQPTSRLLALAVFWVALTVAFEFTFGHYVDGKSWSELAENYALWRGRLWPILLLAIGAAPFIWSRPERERVRGQAGSREKQRE